MNKTVTLTFKRDELLYDIKNMGFVEGDTKKVESEHERHQVMDVGEDGNVDRVTRVLDLTFSECGTVLSLQQESSSGGHGKG